MMKILLSLLLTITLHQSVFAALGAHWTLQDNAASYTVVATVGANASWNGSVHTSSASNTPGPGTTYTRYLLFDGTDDYVDATTSNTGVLQNKSAYTLCCWVRASTTDTSGTHRFIFVSTNGAGSSVRAAIYFNSDGTITAAGRAGDGESAQGKTTTGSYDDNTWHHVAAVFDLAGDAITIYVDGASVSSTGTISFTASTTSNLASLAIALGRSGNSSTNYFKGGLADCRIYDSDESANIGTIRSQAGLGAPAVVKIIQQLSDYRLRRQSKHFDTYGVYALSP